MIKKAIIAVWLVLLTVGALFPNYYESLFSHLHFGSISFPTSLDSLTNPGATDSVATVSHSSQHANANDAIEALEAKLGIGASTAVTNSLFAGTSAGVTGWTTAPSVTNLLLHGSSTLQNFTFQTATGTSATTTNFYSSGFASTTLFRANSEVVGDSTIGKLSVTSCTGCSSGIGTWYEATSTSRSYLAKTLDLVAGDSVQVWFTGDKAGGFNVTRFGFRITSPWSVGTTTLFTTSAGTGESYGLNTVFMATTTETVTFESSFDASVISSMIIQVLSGHGFNSKF